MSRILSFFVMAQLSVFALDGICAQDVKLVFSGEAHSVLYPCDCPREPDGGVFRRAAAIGQLRKSSPDMILLESGGMFAGGPRDVYSQNVELDKKRTSFYLKALEEMRYDALGVGGDEFNFGPEFLKEAVKSTKTPFLSVNLDLSGVRPYIIKEVSGIKFGILGALTVDARDKSSGVNIADPVDAVKRTVAELKSKGADIIIMISQLGESIDQRLLNEVPDINVVVVSYSRLSEDVFSKVRENGFILRPAWQGKKLGICDLVIDQKVIKDARVSEMRLSDSLADDARMRKIIPACFQNSDCKQGRLRGKCSNGGSLDAKCEFEPVEKIKIMVISPKDCAACDIAAALQKIRQFFPGLEAEELAYESGKGAQIAEELGVQSLPAYVFDKRTVASSSRFEQFRKYLVQKGEYALVAPSYIGISYFPGRLKSEQQRLDICMSLRDKNAVTLLENVRTFDPHIHFLDIGSGNIEAGIGEAEDNLRAVCVMKYYPGQAYDYMLCRAKNMQSSWWDDCASGMDTEKIRLCARSDEGKDLLKENIALSNELGVASGVAYLLNNVEIFSSLNPPSREEFEAVIKKGSIAAQAGPDKNKDKK